MKIKKQLCLFLLLSFYLSAHAQWTIPNSDIFSVRMDDIYFVNPDTGWVVASDRVLKTKDGGANWTNQFYEPGLYFRSVEMLDHQRGFAGTLDNVFLRTQDGGETWEDIAQNASPPFLGVCGMSHVGDTVFASGLWNGPPFVYKSFDAGDTWNFIYLDSIAIALVDVHFDNSMVGFVTGQDENGGIVLRTEDGGATWEKTFSSDYPAEWAWKIQRVTADTLVVSIERFNFSSGNGRMLASYDNGLSWTVKEIPTGNADMQGIGFIDSQHGWVGGYGQTISETFDGGETWEYLDIGQEVNRFFIFSDTLVYASGSTVYKYTEEPDVLSAVFEKTQTDIRPDFSVLYGENGKFKARLVLEKSDNVSLALYSLDGNVIEQLFKGRLAAGTYFFEAKNEVPSGLHFLGLQINRGLFSEKVMVP